MLLRLFSETLSEELTTYTVCVWKGLSLGLSITTKASQDWLIPQMRQTEMVHGCELRCKRGSEAH